MNSSDAASNTPHLSGVGAARSEVAVGMAKEQEEGGQALIAQARKMLAAYLAGIVN
ncbi:MAG: hypothetical protein WA642_07085 [Steroidobacteraceae bacterium]